LPLSTLCLGSGIESNDVSSRSANSASTSSADETSARRGNTDSNRVAYRIGSREVDDAKDDDKKQAA